MGRETKIMTPTHHPKKYLLARLGAVVLIVLVLAYLGAGAYLALQVTEPHRLPEILVSSIGIEDVPILSRDGLKLAGWFLPADSERAIILVHGLNSCRACEFSGHFVEFATQLRAGGFNVLMIDLRGHGESEGEHVTFGQQEKQDVLGAMDWLHARGFQQIGALGVSLGAASIVAAATEPRGGQGLRAIVLDSCFNTLSDLLNKNFTDETGYPTFLLPGGFVMARVLLNVDLAGVQPVRDLPRIQVPVLLIYGGRDRYLSPAMIRQMTSARPNTDVWMADDAEHAGTYNAHPQEYVVRVSRFFDSSLR
jgi:pimeloyl-ACP methyl ester carboxylesterase